MMRYLGMPALVSALCVLLGACVAPQQLNSTLELPDQWRGDWQDRLAMPPGQDWWRAGDEPLMAMLIDAVLASNRGFASATERLEEGRALLREARSRALPQLELGAQAARSRSGIDGPGAELIAPDQNSWEVSVQDEWAVDISGATRARLGAARQRLVAEEAALAGLRLDLAATTADTYIELRSLQAESAALLAGLDLARKQEWTAQRLYLAGETTRLQEDMARAERLLLEADLAVLEAALGTLLLGIETLLGGERAELLPMLTEPAPIPRLVTAPPLGEPADLLLRRPDLLQALAELESGRRESQAARRDLYPQMVMSGLLGAQGLTINGDSLGRGSLQRTSVGLSVPLFDFGARRALIEAADARTRQRLLNFEHATLAALEDVESALLQRDRLAAQEAMVHAALQSRREALARAMALQAAGEADLAFVLTQRSHLTQAQLAHAHSSAALARAGVRLYSALGGRWGDATE